MRLLPEFNEEIITTSSYMLNYCLPSSFQTLLSVLKVAPNVQASTHHAKSLGSQPNVLVSLGCIHLAEFHQVVESYYYAYLIVLFSLIELTVVVLNLRILNTCSNGRLFRFPIACVAAHLSTSNNIATHPLLQGTRLRKVSGQAFLPFFVYIMSLPNDSKAVSQEQLIHASGKESCGNVSQYSNSSIAIECITSVEDGCHNSCSQISGEVGRDGCVREAPYHIGVRKTDDEGS